MEIHINQYAENSGYQQTRNKFYTSFDHPVFHDDRNRERSY